MRVPIHPSGTFDLMASESEMVDGWEAPRAKVVQTVPLNQDPAWRNNEVTQYVTFPRGLH